MKLIQRSVASHDKITVAKPRSFIEWYRGEAAFQETFTGRVRYSDCRVDFNELEVIQVGRNYGNVLFGDEVYHGLRLTAIKVEGHHVCTIDYITKVTIGEV